MPLIEDADPHLFALRSLIEQAEALVPDDQPLPDLEQARFQLFKALERENLDRAAKWHDALGAAVNQIKVPDDDRLNRAVHKIKADMLRELDSLGVLIRPGSDMLQLLKRHLRVRLELQEDPSPGRIAVSLEWVEPDSKGVVIDKDFVDIYELRGMVEGS